MEIQRDIGRHDAQIESLQEDMRSVKTDVHEIKIMLAEAKGGWRTLMAVSSFAGILGAGLMKIMYWLGWFK
jgi:chromosome condensin MukBEF ATPase and DNA-binding subunit MukB